MKRLLKVNEVAELFDMSEDRIYTLSREKLIPTVRLGRQLRWDEAALIKFIESGGKTFNGGWRKET